MPRRQQDPYRLVKYVLNAALEGIAGGWTLLLILLWFDIAGLGTLVHSASDQTVPLVILLMSFGVTFGFVGLCWRIMVLLPEED